jgi:thiol-disulfide isomerase/thioredoxin
VLFFSKRHKLIKLIVEVTVMLSVLLVIRAYIQRDAVSGAAPLLAGQLLQGETINLSQYQGAPVLVHFWASWCGICRFEEKGIEAIAADYPVITIAMQSGDKQEISAYMQQRGLEFPVLLDPDGKLASLYGVSAVPASFIIDASGQVRFVELGYSSETGLRMRLWLAAYL